jgi:hypothetical protein
MEIPWTANDFPIHAAETIHAMYHVRVTCLNYADELPFNIPALRSAVMNHHQHILNKGHEETSARRNNAVWL